MMTVSMLQRYLTNLITLLQDGGGKGPAAELEKLANALEPLKEKSVAELVDHLTQNTALPPDNCGKPKGPRKRAADPERINRALQTVRDLYGRATDEEVTYEFIRNTIDQLKTDLSKEEAIALAAAFEVEGKYESKPEALGAVGQKIVLRKSAHERRQLD